ncbi:alpha-amylase family protein [Kineococcus sp. SYSU DK018]|uniref:alpha-amylase family protein n=1 Tax=Kineococcus sp. SYSU DK018 TaxID=3383139 RepID=UPI003D7EBE8E
MPDWVQDAIWWHVYPLGATGAFPHPDPAGDGSRLLRLLPWLDHVVELGANGLLLGPVFASSTHGYDTVDHFRIDPRLSTEEDFDRLVAACRERGLRLLLDGVFNHVGREHPAFRAVLREGAAAPAAGWFRLRWPAGDGPGAVPVHDDFEGHSDLVALDHANPAVTDLVVDVMTHWLARGADGWRLDAAYAVPPERWAPVLTRVRERFPDAYVVGEVIHGDYPTTVAASGMDSVTQYELWKAVWSSLNDTNLHELAWTLQRHDALLETFAPFTFVGNHDVTRIASRLDDERHLPHAVAVLMTVGGTPAVYAGDEHAFRGVKEERAGGDDAVRPPLPPTPADLSPLGLPTFHLHQQLIGLRRRHRWLHRARTTVLHVENARLVLESRAADGEGRLLLALDLTGTGGELPAPGASAVLAGAGELRGGPDGGRVLLPPHGWAVLAG